MALPLCANFGSERQKLDEWVIRPLQETPALAATAKDVAGFAVGANLAGMTGKCLPALDLNGIDFRQPSSEEITAVPWNQPPGSGP